MITRRIDKLNIFSLKAIVTSSVPLEHKQLFWSKGRNVYIFGLKVEMYIKGRNVEMYINVYFRICSYSVAFLPRVVVSTL